MNEMFVGVTRKGGVIIPKEFRNTALRAGLSLLTPRRECS